jgi:hypothetical protein
MPHINDEFVSREEDRAGESGYEVSGTTSCRPCTRARSSSRATSRSAAYVSEFGRFRHGTSNLNYSMYHDRYQRTPAGWKFTERVYEVRYLDVTPLAGSAPPQLRHER